MKTGIEVKEYDLFVGGKFVKTDDIRVIKNPYNGETVGRVCFADSKIVAQAVDHARAGFEIMRKLPAYKRAELLEKMALILEKNMDEISRTLACEAAKPISQAKAETGRCILTFRMAAEEARRINGEIIPLDWAESAKNHTGYIRRFPIGIISAITPFNFPLNLVAHKIAPALAAGNSIILKPAPATPISALWIARAAYEAGVPEGALQVLPADPDQMEPMMTDDRVKMITFTGSAPVGWDLKSKSGKKRITLELGGNAAVIIDKSANIDFAVEKCIIGGFAYSGQICISIQRIFIQSEIYDEFTEKFVNSVKRIKTGDPLDESVLMSSMISEREAAKVESWVNEAVEGGAVILCGGKREGNAVEPTVLSNVTRDMKVYKDEVFGPVVMLDKFDSFDEALAKVNDSRFGLQAGVFTNNLENTMKAFDTIETGGVIINDASIFRIDHMPYGGSKDSGMGREGLKYAIEEMTEGKLMVINRLEGN
jgi:glyceraldehyde-3-phosphate dehydrogenase (NADP+)